MAGHGPWWMDLLMEPFRRLVQDPAAIVAPYVRAGMTVLEPGSGRGFFTLELARRVGPSGRVIALDVQPRMIAGLRRRGLGRATYSLVGN
jgi:ubiquinone/menaquinone biosynthesis C-methylase UbiE